MDNNINEQEYLKSCIGAFKKYLPKRIVEKILTNPYNVRVEAERRFVTILFGDISGFTALSERLDPEDVIKVINKYFTKMVHIVDKYGGDIDKFVGDAVIVVFGAPIAHKDDPERAIRAALEMQKEMATIEPVYANGEYVKVTMHIGINSGEVVALNMGVDDRMEYTVMGDSVNLTARLEATAQSGEIIIPDRTYKYVKDIFDVDVLAPVMVKGKKDAIPIFRVKGVKENIKAEEGYDFIGSNEVKEKTMTLINEFLAHKPFTLAVRGGAGTGKTKYSKYIEDKADRKNIKIIEIAGKSFQLNVPYISIKDFVSKILHISYEDEFESVKEKIDNVLNENERKGLYSIFNISEIDNLDENQFQNMIFESIDSLLRNLSMKDKYLCFISDTHYIDASSMAVAIKLHRKYFNNPSVSFVVTSREEANFERTDEIIFDNMNEELCRQLIISRLKNKEPDKLFLNHIYEKTSRNPNYTVEILKLLIDKNLLYEEDGLIHLKNGARDAMPDSLKSVFLEQMDKLTEGEKTFLQYSSVIGREFNKNEASEYLGYSHEESDAYVKNLLVNGYLFFIEKERYSFSSELFYDAVYNSLTKEKRSKLHGGIASYIEAKHKELNEKLIRDVSHHYDLSGNIHKAPEFLEKTALFDRKYFAFSQAVEIYFKVIEYYKKQNSFKNLAVTVTRIANVYILTGKLKEGCELLETYKGAFESDKEQLCQYHFISGILYDKMGSQKDAEEFYDSALSIALETDNRELLPKIYNSFGILNSSKGKYEDALKYYNKALDISIKNEHRANIASEYINIGRVWGFMNSFENAEKYYNLAYEIQKDIDDSSGMVISLVNLGTIYDNQGNHQKAEEIYNQALLIAKKTGNRMEEARILNNLSTIMFLTSRFEDAHKGFESASNVYEEIEDKKGLAEVLANIAEIDTIFGDYTEALPVYKKVLRLCDESGHHHLKLYASINYANVLSFLGYLADSEKELTDILAIAKKHGMPDFEAMSENILGKVHGLQGDIDGELSLLTNGLRIAEEIKNPDLENNIKSMLVKAYSENGEVVKAEHIADEVYNYAKSAKNDILLSDVMASMADICLKRNDEDRIAEIAAQSYEISERTKSKISLIRNNISLARYYLLMNDFTSCAEMLKKGEDLARISGSIEHQIIIYRIGDLLYEKTENIQMRYNVLMKLVNVIEVYIQRAGDECFENLINKRKFLNYYCHYILCMTELYDFKFIKEQLKNYNERTVRLALEDMKVKGTVSEKMFMELI